MSAAIRTARLFTDRVVAPFHLIRGAARVLGLIVTGAFAVLDAAVVRCVTEPTGAHLAHARAAWLHRWCRIARRVLGLRLDQRGFTPASGIVVANHTSLLDAILLAAVRPCVFVAGGEVRGWPIVGLLAQLGGTLFVDRRRRHDAARVNFMIQRAIQRRLLVVIFPECTSSDGSTLRAFTSALFQPAAEQGCTLTAAAINYHIPGSREGQAPLFEQETRFLRQGCLLVTRHRAGAVVSFGGPRFRRGDRKQLARQLRGEVLDLKLRHALPAC
jgi:1-acyl-sn-glycerol-3-phosphate acyltransferase